MRLSKQYLDDLTYEINGAAIEVHKTIGPGLLESVYHKCLEHELRHRGISFQADFQPQRNKGHKEVKLVLLCSLFLCGKF